MNPEYEKQLEAQVDRALKGLPELRAPRSLVPRVMAALERRAFTPWYARSWQTWPGALQAVSLGLLLACFGGLCFGSWELVQLRSITEAGQSVSALGSSLMLAWNVVNVLAGAVVQVVKHLNTGVLVVGLLLAGFGYALCVGLGTAYVRLALARR